MLWGWLGGVPSAINACYIIAYIHNQSGGNKTKTTAGLGKQTAAAAAAAAAGDLRLSPHPERNEETDPKETR